MEQQPRSDDAETIVAGVDAGNRPRPAPEQIGPYRIEARLGFGGMGEVFLAWDDHLERRVAIKRIRQEVGLSPEQRERFRREARMAARLSHPGVVQIYDLICEDSAIVMEYVEGRTLAERLATERLETSEVLRLALEIAEGLAAAHEAGLIHRDLKAANILITRSGHAKILDFGLARPVIRDPDDQGSTRQGVVLGTCHAMSPEQAQGDEVDERSDLFSFGSLIHEMLTGRPPFQGKDIFDSMRRVVTEEPVDPRLSRPDLPVEAAALLRRLLAKNRDHRPANAREVIGVLEQIRSTSSSTPVSVASEESTSDLATGEVTPLELPEPFHWEISGTVCTSRKSRRILVMGVIAALLVIGAVVFYRFWSARPLRVVVVRPEDSNKDEEINAAEEKINIAVLDALSSLGITSVDSKITGFSGKPLEASKAFRKQFLLIGKPTREGETALVTLTRANERGEVIHATEKPIPLGRENQQQLDDVVNSMVYDVFPDHQPLLGTPTPPVRPEDLSTFRDIQARVDEGNALPEDLTRLEEMMGSNPRFLGAPLLAARIAHSLYLSHRESEDLDRAHEFIQKARSIAGDDPRTLRQEFQIALTRNDLSEARTALERLEKLDPDDPDILPLQADLAEQQGDLEEATSLMTEAVKQTPSWQNQYRLADLEVRRGQIEKARQQIEAMRAESPDNVWAREALGSFEMTYGSLDRAEQIYSGLRDAIPERALTNLGSISVLRNNFEDAAGFYNQALGAKPDHVNALINLAEVETELGRKDKAREHYRLALDLLTKREAELGQLSLGDALLKAQCLARLGQVEDAVAIAKALTQKTASDPTLCYQNALVYSLAKERTLAIENARAALEGGYPTRWFSGPALRWLQDTPELRHWFPRPL